MVELYQNDHLTLLIQVEMNTRVLLTAVLCWNSIDKHTCFSSTTDVVTQTNKFSDLLKVWNVICNLNVAFVAIVGCNGMIHLFYFNEMQSSLSLLLRLKVLTLVDLSHWWSNYPGLTPKKCTHAIIFTCNSQKRDQRNRIFFRVKCSNARIKAY